jgi:multiple sugar transport system ATP-binding protein
MGAPLELYDRPGNIFVAGFIGSPAMNLLEGRIEGGAFLTNGGMRLPLPTGRFAGAAASGRPAVYGLRPEHITLSDAGVPVEVVVVEPTGSETLIVVKGGHTELDCLFRSRILPNPGETLRIQPDTAHVHLFDAETGQRLD